MDINLRFFASIREALGTSQEAANVPAGVTTVGAV
ncbi:MAG TPA: molybdopterin synthase sulfur carrier subunit, partial [Telluria sp.]|nr:molybdopterin synthase sulfur carrier subunit [Telluria sp.]